MTPEIHKIIRSSRKTLALEITPNAQLIVRLPRFTPVSVAHRFVRDKKHWILKKQEAVLSQKIAPKTFREGETFFYLGKTYPLNFTQSIRSSIIFNEQGFYISRKYEFQAKEVFISWYKTQAQNIIRNRVDFFAQKYDFHYNTIKITSAQKRWGSCTSQKNINFTWRLMMAPMEVIDAVVVHELAHTRELNHSQKFWRIVTDILPDYEKRKKWLSEHRHHLKL